VRRRSQQPLPGNDGKWFLELVGAVPDDATPPPPEPAASEEPRSEEEDSSALPAVAALRNQAADGPDATATVAPPTTIELATTTGADPHEDEEFSETTHAGPAEAATLGVAATAASRSEAAPTEVLETAQVPPTAQTPQPSPTAETSSLTDTWRATPTPPPPTDWAAEHLSASRLRARRSRLPLLITVVVAVAAIAIAALWLPTLVDGRAAEQADEYRTALVEVRSSLAGAQAGLEDATEPDSQEGELLGVPPQVEPLAVASDSALAVAAEPLPEPLPLLPSGPIDDLVPSSDAVAAVGADGETIANRINDTTTYRLLLTKILAVPVLPIEADAMETAALGAELAATDTDSRNAAAQLPSDPAFADHKELVTETVAGFDEWSAEYLGALTAGDAALAADLIAQLEATQFALSAALVPGLATVRSEVDQAIVVLHGDATTALAALP
jgi:hypothetical protein